jgi:hypothetical protein
MFCSDGASAHVLLAGSSRGIFNENSLRPKPLAEKQGLTRQITAFSAKRLARPGRA